jgi:nucleoid DNA-binding protein
MRRGQWLALGTLLAAIVVVLSWAGPGRSQKAAAPPPDEPLATKLAKSAKLSEENAMRFLQALGPAIRAELAAGKTVNLPGLGTFRVVRVPDHKDMIIGGRSGGTPIIVPGKNEVEFLADGSLSSAANSATAIPSEVVPPFQYVPLPGQTPGQKTGRTHVPTIRAK